MPELSTEGRLEIMARQKMQRERRPALRFEAYPQELIDDAVAFEAIRREWMKRTLALVPWIGEYP
jgi:hypothetical protein